LIGTIPIINRAAEPAWDNGRPTAAIFIPNIDDYMNGQLRELLTKLRARSPASGSTACGQAQRDWHLDKTYALIHQLQPAALIIRIITQSPKPGEDVQTFERDLPGRNTAGFNTTYVATPFPWKSCTSSIGSWGFNIGDIKYKSPEEIEEMLVRAAGNNSNLLLNIARANGEIQTNSRRASVCRRMGRQIR